MLVTEFFSGNEWLTDCRGFTAGSFLIYNSECTSNGPMKGLSKATCYAYVWMACEIPMVQALNFGGAWTSVSMDKFTLARIPIVMCLAEAVDAKFWVSFH